jgi:hypothetical protein
VARVIELPWMKRKRLSRLIERSLRAVIRKQNQQGLQEQADIRRAQQDLNTKP